MKLHGHPNMYQVHRHRRVQLFCDLTKIVILSIIAGDDIAPSCVDLLSCSQNSKPAKNKTNQQTTTTTKTKP